MEVVVNWEELAAGAEEVAVVLGMRSPHAAIPMPAQWPLESDNCSAKPLHRTHLATHMFWQWGSARGRNLCRLAIAPTNRRGTRSIVELANAAGRRHTRTRSDTFRRFHRREAVQAELLVRPVVPVATAEALFLFSLVPVASEEKRLIISILGDPPRKTSAVTAAVVNSDA